VLGAGSVVERDAEVVRFGAEFGGEDVLRERIVSGLPLGGVGRLVGRWMGRGEESNGMEGGKW
jgi:hypothetical protein